MVFCTNCQTEIEDSKMFLHEGFCKKNIKYCFKCKEKIPIEEYEEHLENHNTKKPEQKEETEQKKETNTKKEQVPKPQSKEDLNIVFQGNDNFYDLKKFLSLKNTIQLNYNKKSLIMTLLKNNNIFATGLFTIRQGEQNIFFNFENNKKGISNKIVNINNLSDCIITCYNVKRTRSV